MTHTTLIDQNKLVFQKIDAILNPELVLKLLAIFSEAVMKETRVEHRVDVVTAGANYRQSFGIALRSNNS